MKRARGVEGDRLLKHGVAEGFDESEYDPALDGEIAEGRWVGEERGRSRVVTKDFKRSTTDQIKLNFAGTPDSHGLRCLPSLNAESPERKMVLTDAESAYYQSPAKRSEHGRLPVMRAPEDICRRGKPWRWAKAMPGMQTAGRSWSDHQADVYCNKGSFDRCPLDGQMYRHAEPNIRMEVHDDDGAASAQDRPAADWHVKFMTPNIDCTAKIMGLGPDEVREAAPLKKLIRVDETGWELEADCKHILNLLRMHGLDHENAKGCGTPRDNEIDRMPDGDVDLGEEPAQLFRTGAGIGQHVHTDRYDIQCPIKECRREAARPTWRAAARLKRVARYLVNRKRLGIELRFWTEQERRVPKMHDEVRRVRWLVDASQAGRERTRKSTTAGVSMRGPHNLGEFVATQVPISISSGGSEFYSLLRAAAEVKFVRNPLQWLEFGEKQPTPELCVDATAALGAAARLGVGKRMRHIDTQHLFIQQEVNGGHLRLKKVKGGGSQADAPLAGHGGLEVLDDGDRGGACDSGDGHSDPQRYGGHRDDEPREPELREHCGDGGGLRGVRGPAGARGVRGVRRVRDGRPDRAGARDHHLRGAEGLVGGVHGREAPTNELRLPQPLPTREDDEVPHRDGPEGAQEE